MFDTSFLHPMVVHFPIALIIVGFIAEIISLFIKKDFFSTSAFYLLILGTLGVLAAYITGNSAGEGITEAGALSRALETHESAAELSLWIIIIAAAVRVALVLLKKYKGIFKIVGVTLFFIAVISIIRTGHYGGQLVYKHAAGVQIDYGFDAQNSIDSNINKESNDSD
jgi:uncharacterized membrane protein